MVVESESLATEDLAPPKEAAVTVMGRRLKELIQEHGSLTFDQVRDWIIENYQGVKPLGEGYINLVASYGYSGNRKYWHKTKTEDGTALLVLGPKPSVRSGEDGTLPSPPLPPLDDASRNALEDLQKQFQVLGEKLGISVKAAASAAEYVTRNYDLYSPEAVWNGLRQCTQVFPAQRKLWWTTWMNHTNTEVPPELTAMVNRSATQQFDGKSGASGAGSGAQSRRWLAIDGDVLATYLEDPEGMTMSEARILAADQRQRQRERMGAMPAERDESTVITLLHEQGETERARLALSQPTTATGTGDLQTLMHLQDARIEALRKESDARIESIRKEAEVREEARSSEGALREEMRTKELTGHLERMQRDNQHVVEMLNQSHKHELEAMTAAIERFDSRKSSNFVTELDSVIPGLGTRMVEKLLSPGPAVADPDIELKREALQIARESLPGLFQVGHDIAQATDRLARAQYEQRTQYEQEERRTQYEQEQEELRVQEELEAQAHVVLPCVGCGVAAITQPPPGVEIVICPTCHLVQSLSGVVYAPVSQVQGPALAEPASEPVVSSLDATVPLVIAPPISPPVSSGVKVEAPTQEPVHAG